MTHKEAKQDLARRLEARDIRWASMTAKNISFEDLARDSKMFVTVHGATFPPGFVGEELDTFQGAGYLVLWKKQ